MSTLFGSVVVLALGAGLALVGSYVLLQVDELERRQLTRETGDDFQDED